MTKWIVAIGVIGVTVWTDLAGHHQLSAVIFFAFIGGYWAYRWASAGSTTRRTD